MHSSKPRLVVPYGLKTLLEGVSRAVLKTSPSNITEFAALYFRELIAFREENPNLDITDLVREFHFTRVEGWIDRMPEKRADLGDKFMQDISVMSPLSEEPKRKEKSTDTEEDQLHEGPEPEYSSKTTQCPSTHCELLENEPSPTGPEPSPKGPELAYVPADPAQLAAQMLGNIDSVHSMNDVGTSVQSLSELSLSSENTTAAPVEGAAEDATLTPATEGSAESVRLESAVQSQASVVLGPSSSQAERSTSDVDQASSNPLQDEPPPPAPPPPPLPPPKDPLEAVPFQSEIEVTSTIQAMPIHTDDEPATEGEVPPYVEQFPQQIVIPFLEQVACLIEIQQPLMPSLNAGQFTCTKLLDPSADDAECDPERMETTAQMASAEQGFIMSVAIPLDEVMSAKRGSASGDKQAGINAFAGSYGIAGEITFTSGPVRRADS
ncbi:calcium-binding tyrosine phosphorylation-regulated protein isoform X2 [Dermochelys coriacea]|uniref:calcium-binding tyrosine phosphorylation-regulated protein isoform X2 n=1 Tax=Dermochelys coriacea TaxID=27794 RepID=UPI001CA901DB|nr:calcium-binding tyrosine phosphorylation-regulated protein isoform X2 [Dermochelys coriacea]